MVKVVKIGEEEEPEIVEEVVTKDPIPDEEPSMTELDEFHIKQKFVKKVYYFHVEALKIKIITP